MRNQENRNRSREQALVWSTLICLASTGLLMVCDSAQAADLCWTNIAGGNWSVAGNWDPNQVPGAGDNAYITNNGTFTVAVTVNASVNTLILGGPSGVQTLDLSGGTFTLEGLGMGSVQSGLSISGGTLAGAGLLALAGQLNWTGGTISGLVQCNGGSIGGSGQKDLNGGRLVNAGLLAITTTALVRTYSGSVISNLVGGTIDLTVDGGTTWPGYGGQPTIYNYGLFRKSGDAGTSPIADAFNNFGTVEVGSGTLALGGGGTSGAAFTVVASGGLNLSGGTHDFIPGSVVSGLGNFTVSGGTANLAGTFAINGLTPFNGGTANFSGTNYTITSALVVSGGTVNFNGSGLVAVPSVTVSAGTLGGGNSVADNGPLNWTGGTISGVVQCNGGSISGSGQKDLNGGRLVNAGLLAVTTTTLVRTYDGSVISNLVGGTIDLTVDGGTTWPGYGGQPTVYNAGLFRKSGGTGTSALGDLLNSSGMVEVDTGTLSLGNGGVISGVGAVSNNAALNLPGSTTTFTASSLLTGSGVVMCNGATLNLSGACALTGTLVVNSGTANFNNATPASVGNLTFNGGTLGGSGWLVVSNPMSWTGGNLAGAVQCNGGSLSGSNEKDLAGGRLVNTGLLAITTTALVRTYSGSVISNLVGGTIDLTVDGGTTWPGYGGQPTIYNYGLFRKSGGAGTSPIADAFNNFGTIEVESGTVSINSSYLQSGATLAFGLSAPNLAGHLNLPGNVNLDGLLRINLLNDYTPAVGDAFSLVSYGSHGGMFQNLSLAPLGPGLAWQTTYDATRASLRVVAGVSGSAQIAGSVKDNLGRPVANVNVFAYTTNTSQSLYVSGSTDTNGQYTLGVTNGVWQVGVQGLAAAGFIGVQNQIVVVSGSNAEADFVTQSSSGQHYLVSITVSPPDAGTVSGTGLFLEGSLVALTATPTNTPPYLFVNWTENGLVQSVSSNYDFILGHDRQLVANFALPYYSLSASVSPVGAGTVSGGGSYLYGTTNRLTASANFGYAFTNWTEGNDLLGTSPTLDVVVWSNRLVTANFTEANLVHVVTTATSPGGLAHVTGAGTYTNGQSTLLSAPLWVTNPPLVYAFREFQVNGSGLSGGASLTKILSTVDATNLQYVALYDILAVPPSITSDPQDVTVPIFSPTEFQAGTFSSVTPSYQWQFNGTNLLGATASRLTLDQVLPTQAGHYRLIVANSAGSATSGVAALTVARVVRANATNGPTGTLVELPLALLAAGDENSLGFSLDFDPGQLTLAGVTPGSGINGASFTFDTSQTGHLGLVIDQANGDVFSLGTQEVARVQFRLGQPSATNVPAWSDLPIPRNLSNTNGQSLLVLFQAGSVVAQLVPPSITQPPEAQTVWPGSNVTFTVAAQGSLPMSFQWQQNGTAVPGATGAILTMTNVQSSGSGNYSVWITNAAGSASSAAALLTVLTPRPDLAVSAVSAPATAAAGQAVPVVWTLSNLGNADAPAGWSHTLWVAADAAGDSAQLVAALPFTTLLPAGHSLSVTGVVMVPFSVVGDLFFMVAADGSNNVVELNENNNAAVASQSTQITAGDLTIQALSAPAAAQFGQTMSVSWVVANTGSSPIAGPWQDCLFLGTNPNSLSGPLGLGTVPAVAPLAPGTAYTNTQRVLLPLGAQRPAGNYYLTVLADCFDNVTEQTRTNNTMAVPVTLSFPPLPDLVVTPLTTPVAASPGQTVTLVWGITNQGAAATASGGWSEAVYLCSQGGAAFNPDQPGSLLTTFTFTNDLAAGGLLLRTQQVTLPPLALAGNFFFVVQADSGKSVVEVTTTNNLAEATNATSIAAALTLSLPVTQIAESAANPILVGTVTRNGDRSQPLEVALANSGPTHLSVPASVTISAGQFSAEFQATVLDDGVATDSQLVTVGATATGYLSGTAQLTVLNTDQPQLTLTPVTNVVLEGQSLLVTVSQNPVATQLLTVALSCAGSSRFGAPATVQIPANARSATFTVTTVDDGVVETPTLCTLTATAAGYLSGSVGVLLNDADSPQVTLTLASHAVSEKAGPQATTGTVTRTPVTPNAVSIELDSGDTNAAQVPLQVTIPANAASVEFPVAAVDDGLVTPPRTNVIGGFVLAAGTSTRVAAVAPDILVINDADGASLVLEVAQNTVKEGLDPATTGTVTRNTPATNDLVVRVNSSDPLTLEPVAITIPRNQASAAFNLTTLVSANRGNHALSLTASATGYSDGTCNLLVTDTNLADLAVTRVTAPATATAQSYATLSYRVVNQGYGPVATNFMTRVFLATDRFGGNSVLAGQFEFKGTMLVGEFFDQTLTVFTPQSVGNYWVVVKVDAEGQVPEIRTDNNTGVSAAPIMVGAAYLASLQADLHTALAGTPVPLHGVATNSSGGPAQYVPVDIHVLVRGAERVILALTDASGNFSTTFRPLANEAGTYQVWAAAPGVSAGTVQDSFSLLGMAASPASASVRIAQGSTGGVSVTLLNLSDVPLHGITAIVSGSPAGVDTTVKLSDTTLAGSGSLQLDCTFVAALGATGGVAQVSLSSLEGATNTVVFGVGVDRLRPVFTAYPGSLVAGMTRGFQTSVGFDVVNTGNLASGPITLGLPVTSWLQPGTRNPLPALAPGQTNHVTLLLTPAADLPLGPYSGSLALASDAASLSVPFNFRCLSEAKGDLLVTAQDDYTYFAAGSPNLAGASVTVLDSYSHAVVTNGVTDTNGLFFGAQLPEGYYDIQATALGHSSYAATRLLLAGQTNPVTAFLPRQTVQYIWSVVPTEVPDQTRIVLTTVFDTAVPVPVITVDPAIIHLQDLTNPVNQINLTIANHGLVAALSAKLNLPDLAGWSLEPLITDLGTLPAESSLVIPVMIRRSTGPSPKFSPATDAAGSVAASWLCGGTSVPIYFVSDEVNAPPPPGPVLIPFGDPGLGWNWDGWDTSGGPTTVTASAPANVVEGPASPCEKCVKGLLSASESCVWDAVSTLLPSGPVNCLASAGTAAYGIATSGVGDPVATVITAESVAVSCAWSVPKNTPGVGAVINTLDCVYGMAVAAYQCAPALSGNDLAPGVFTATVPEAVTRKLPALLTLAQRADRLNAHVAFGLQLFGDRAWLANGYGDRFAAWMGAYASAITASSDGGARITDAERTALLALPLPDGMTHSNLTDFIDRWDRTMDYYAAGVYRVADVPAGQSVNFIAFDAFTNTIVAMTNAVALNQADGFSDPTIAMATAYQDFHTQLVAATQGAGGSVCAQVKLQLDQQAVMSREAFKASLQVINSSTSVLDHVFVQVTAVNGAQVDSTSRFGMVAPRLENLTAVDGTGVIPAGATGTATWTLVPTVDAAPINATVYYVSGTLSYQQDGLLITVPLTGVPITVHPIPQLYLQYFMQRDVYGDDPFTPQTEPSIPFNLAVMVANRGYGVAHNFEITSSQPKIVDNEKGLLINFQIIGTQVNGQNLTPSLTATFGDIAGGGINIARWLMVSSLQGEFQDYSATFQSLDDFGNRKTAIVQDVAIHEMIHLVQAPGAFEDGKPDFLVDDVPNAQHLPDTLYLSDGTTNPVNVLQTSSIDGPPSVGHLQTYLTAPMPAGWVYLLVPDPGNGQYTLTRVVRSDGVEIYFGTNVWTTDRTFVGLGRRPVLENRIHLLDYNSPGAYTLYYTPAPAPDTIPPVSALAALPANSQTTFQVQWSGQDNPGGSGVASYDVYVSTDGGVFAPWLQQTRTTSALFQGAWGHQYGFYSAATDYAGNREGAHTTPDALTSVSLVSLPPILPAIPVQFVNAGDTLQFTLGATVPDGSIDILTYRLGADAPPAAALDLHTGALTWPTSRCAGAGTNVFSVVVSGSGVPPLSATGSVSVVVVKSNTAPVLSPIANFTINDGDLLNFTCTAADLDCPPNAVTFTLASGAPAGAAINPVSGLLTWTPTAWQAPSTNLISIIATDNGVPPLSATQQFTVIVQHVLPDFTLGIGSTNLLAAETNSIPVVLNSGAGLTNLSFLITPSLGRLSGFSLRSASAEVLASTVQPVASNQWLVNLSLNSALSLTGPRTLGGLTFVAVTNDHSAIVPVAISQVLARGAQGRVFTNPATANGLVIVVAAEPVLMPASASSLTIYGHPGSRCSLQYRTDLGAQAVWSDWTTLVMTDRVVTVAIPLLATPNRFYRAYELPLGPGLSIKTLSGPVFGLTLSGQPGTHFTLQQAANLSVPVLWSNVSGTTLTNYTHTLYWTNPGAQRQFFRAMPQ